MRFLHFFFYKFSPLFLSFYIFNTLSLDKSHILFKYAIILLSVVGAKLKVQISATLLI